MTRTQPNRHLVAIDEYAMAVFREVIRLSRRRPSCDAEDIAQMVTEKFLTDADGIIARYPNPVRFARAAAKNTAISHERCERAQRGEGVRLVDVGNGQLAPRRRIVSGNVRPPDGGDELFDTVGDRCESFADQVMHAQDDAVQLERCLAGIPPGDRSLFMLVHGNGHTVQEAAVLLGQCRETVSRRISRIRRLIDQNRVGMTHNAQEGAT
ncbi:unannotated protein [freshwater metagenome]|uniref:Unannotated protein n=1 Tax=freshwater metagenome TaxID=449393 RepID=A0A6J7F333_9ZZZZ|nr:sigma-70 family RNA polymerase sigma factor [Actinomycetota bacterium]